MDTERHDIAQLIRSNRLGDELTPIKQLPGLIPSSRPGAGLARRAGDELDRLLATWAPSSRCVARSPGNIKTSA